MTAITRANLTVRVSVPYPAGGEFSWQGIDEGDERCGRGWAVLEPEGDLRGWPEAAKKAMDILDVYRIEREALDLDLLGTPEHLENRSPPLQTLQKLENVPEEGVSWNSR